MILPQGLLSDGQGIVEKIGGFLIFILVSK
jgi:hypothetical protein